MLVGDGVFETLRAYGGVPFAWRRHHERLVLSRARHRARGSELRVPPARRGCRARRRTICARHACASRSPGGESPLGSERGDAAADRDRRRERARAPRRRTRTSSPSRGPATSAVRSRDSRRSRTPRTSGRSRTRASTERSKRCSRTRAATSARRPDPTSSSCSRSVLHTPPGEAGCLLGVTRALILELAAGLGHPDRGGGAPTRRAAPVRRGVPLLDDARGPGHRPRRRTEAAGRAAVRSPPASPTAFTDLVARDLDP